MLSCEEVRIALSAQMDGEPLPHGMPQEVLDLHVSHCSECQQWLDNASDLTRKLHVSGVDEHIVDAEDLVDSLLASSDYVHVARRAHRVFTVAKVLLGLVILMYLVWFIYLMAQSGAISLPAQGNVGVADALLTDSGVTKLGIALMLVVALWRPQGIPSILPLFITMAFFSVGFVVRDVVLGTISASGWIPLALYFVSVLSLLFVWVSYKHIRNPWSITWKSILAKPISE